MFRVRPDVAGEGGGNNPVPGLAGRYAPGKSLVVMADPEGRTTYVDSAARAYTGCSGEALKGHGWLDVLHPDDQQRAAKAWTHAVATGGRCEAEYRYRRHDGAYRWFRAKAICDRDTAGRIRGWFIVSEEVGVPEEVGVSEEVGDAPRTR